MNEWLKWKTQTPPQGAFGLERQAVKVDTRGEGHTKNKAEPNNFLYKAYVLPGMGMPKTLKVG